MVLVEQLIVYPARMEPKAELSVVTQINVVRLLDGIWNNLPLCGSRESEPL